MNNPKVYIIVLNYKTWQDTIECLESVFQLNYSNYHVVVVDNDSPNESLFKLIEWANEKFRLKKDSDNIVIAKNEPNEIREIISHQKYKDKLTIIKAESNKGYSSGNNIGIKLGMSDEDMDYLWILNNDVVVEPNSLSFLVEKALLYKEKKQKIGLIGSKIMYYHNPKIIQCAGGAKFNKYTTFGKQIGGGELDNNQWDISEIDDLGIISGACSFVDRLFIEEVGLLSEDYFLYFEEMDWAQRGFLNGWKLGYCYKSKIYHKEGKTTGGGDKIRVKKISKLSDFYFNRNRLLISIKFNNIFGVFITYTIMLLVIVNRIKKLQIDRAVLFIKILFKPSLKINNSNFN